MTAPVTSSVSLPPTAPLADRFPRPTRFAEVMAGALESGGASGAATRSADDPTRVAQAQEAAEQLVASVLVQPILAMARDSVWRESGPFAPGAAERRFGPMLDQQIADRIVGGSNFPLVSHLRDQMLGLRAERPTDDPFGRMP